MRLDLHLHSTASDGNVTPGTLVREAAKARLTVVSLTDHDTAEGVAEAVAAGAEVGLTVIPGIEVSTQRDGRDVHLLGYGIDPEAESLLAHQRFAREARSRRMEEMVARLKDEGVEVPLEEVWALSDGGEGMPGRPHLARVLVARGYAESVSHAFDTLIGNQHPAFVPTRFASPEDGLRIIQESGGIPVWAHPPRDLLDEWLDGLVADGLAGLEAYRPGWPANRQRRVARYARSQGLLTTGGSDWHGAARDLPLGDFWLQENQAEGLLERLGVS